MAGRRPILDLDDTDPRIYDREGGPPPAATGSRARDLNERLRALLVQTREEAGVKHAAMGRRMAPRGDEEAARNIAKAMSKFEGGTKVVVELDYAAAYLRALDKRLDFLVREQQEPPIDPNMPKHQRALLGTFLMLLPRLSRRQARGLEQLLARFVLRHLGQAPDEE